MLLKFSASTIAGCVALLAAMTPSAGKTQDLGRQFTDAKNAFLIEELWTEKAVESVEALLPRLVGRWILASKMFAGFDATSDIEKFHMAVERSCGFLYWELKSPQGYRFDMIRSGERDGRAYEFTTTYSHVFGNIFSIYTDENDFIDFMALRDAETGVVPPPVHSGIRRNGSGTRYGTVGLFHPSGDILVLANEVDVRIFLRCPAQ